MHLNSITYAGRNLFTSAREHRCSCDVVYSSAQQQPIFQSVRHISARIIENSFANGKS